MDLHSAAFSGDITAVKAFIAQLTPATHHRIDVKGYVKGLGIAYGVTPRDLKRTIVLQGATSLARPALWYAVLARHVQVAQALIDAGASLDDSWNHDSGVATLEEVASTPFRGEEPPWPMRQLLDIIAEGKRRYPQRRKLIVEACDKALAAADKERRLPAMTMEDVEAVLVHRKSHYLDVSCRNAELDMPRVCELMTASCREDVQRGDGESATLDILILGHASALPLLLYAPNTLRVLDLSTCRASELVEPLSCYLADCNTQCLETLVMSDMGLRASELATLLPVLTFHPGLRRLGFADNPIRTDGAQQLAQSLQSAAWEYLDISHCLVEQNGVIAIFDAVIARGADSPLLTLDLHGNRTLHDDGITRLCDVVALGAASDGCPPLRSIELPAFADGALTRMRSRRERAARGHTTILLELLHAMTSNRTLVSLRFSCRRFFEAVNTHTLNLTFSTADVLRTMMERNISQLTRDVPQVWPKVRGNARREIRALFYAYFTTRFMPCDVLFDTVVPYLIVALDGFDVSDRLIY